MKVSAEKESVFKASGLQKTDGELLLACRRGDQDAWNELVDRFQRLVSTVPRRAGLSEEQVSDVFQEVFLTLFQKMDEIEQPDKLRSWLVTTAKFKSWNVVRTALKKLEERCQTILTMLYLQDEPAAYVEVAKAVGVSDTSISPLRARCLKKLLQILEK